MTDGQATHHRKGTVVRVVEDPSDNDDDGPEVEVKCSGGGISESVLLAVAKTGGSASFSSITHR